MNTKIAKWGILGFIFFGLFFFILGLIMALPTYLLWNWLAPVFGLPVLTLWESFGVLLLCKFFFPSSWEDVSKYNLNNVLILIRSFILGIEPSYNLLYPDTKLYDIFKSNIYPSNYNVKYY